MDPSLELFIGILIAWVIAIIVLTTISIKKKWPRRKGINWNILVMIIVIGLWTFWAKIMSIQAGAIVIVISAVVYFIKAELLHITYEQLTKKRQHRK